MQFPRNEYLIFNAQLYFGVMQFNLLNVNKLQQITVGPYERQQHCIVSFPISIPFHFSVA